MINSNQTTLAIEEKPRILTMIQASEFLNLKLSRLRYEVFHKRIPYFKLGRSIRFEEKELTRWLMNQKQEVRQQAD